MEVKKQLVHKEEKLSQFAKRLQRLEEVQARQNQQDEDEWRLHNFAKRHLYRPILGHRLQRRPQTSVSDRKGHVSWVPQAIQVNMKGIPQINGQVESANQVLLRGLKKRLEKAKGTWAEEVPRIVWAYHTTP